MQYLVCVIAEGNELASPAEDAAIDAFNDKLRAGGHWVYANGLAFPGASTVVDARGKSGPVFTDGPFIESKEFMAGFWIIDAPSREVARRLAAEGSKACNRKIELRPMHGSE